MNRTGELFPFTSKRSLARSMLATGMKPPGCSRRNKICYASNVSAAYYDTRKVAGGCAEIHMDPPHIISAFANWKHVHIAMEEGDGPVVDRAPIT